MANNCVMDQHIEMVLKTFTTPQLLEALHGFSHVDSWLFNFPTIGEIRKEYESRDENWTNLGIQESVNNHN